jgi:hypothetical protein
MRRAARLVALLIGCLVLRTSVIAQPSRNADDKRDVYRHDRTGFEFVVPSGWTVLWTGSSSDGGDQMYLRYFAAPETYVAIWMKPEVNTTAEADAWLQLAVKMQANQRRGVANFAFRPERTQRQYIGRHQAEIAVADFIERDQQMVEYFTWVFTERTRVQFDVRGTPERSADVNAALEGIVTTARIP